MIADLFAPPDAATTIGIFALALVAREAMR